MLYQSNFSTFPHGTIRYRSWLVFSFRGLCPRFFTREYKPTLFWQDVYHKAKLYQSHTGLSPSLIAQFHGLFEFDIALSNLLCSIYVCRTPHSFLGLNYIAFDRLLITISIIFFLFLPLLRCFSSRGSLV